MNRKKNLLGKRSLMILLAFFTLLIFFDSDVSAGLGINIDASNNVTFQDANVGPYTLHELAAGGSNTFYIPATEFKVIDASPTFERRYKSPDKFKAVISLNYDPDTDEYAYTGWQVPENYNSATGVTVKIYYYTSATYCDVKWVLSYYILADGTSDPTLIDTAETNAIVTVPSQGYQIDVLSLPSISSGLAPSDILSITLWRHAGSGSDTCSADAKLIGIGFEY